MTSTRFVTIVTFLLALCLWVNDVATASNPKAATPAAKTAPAKAQTPPAAPGGPATEAVAAYRRGEFAKAKAIWERLAANGDAQAMNNLGVLYDLGQGVEPDMGRALNYFAQSAKAGHASGMSN